MTEQKLWETLRHTSVAGLALTRIETGTRLGVSDIEYVGTQAHGWVELKVGVVGKVSLKLGHAVTKEQAVWLLEHQRPSIKLISWVLIGIYQPGVSQWDQFLVLPPDAAALLAMPRRAKSISYVELSRYGKIFVTAYSALQAINQGALRK